MFKAEFTRLCNEKGIAPTVVCVSIGLSNAAYSEWKEDSVPRKTTLAKLETYFSLPQGYFNTFLKQTQTKKESTVIANDALNPKIHKIVRLLEKRDIPDDVIDFIYQSLENYNK